MRRAALATLAALLGCGGPTEAPRVERDVRADGAGLQAAMTDQGYVVTLDEASLAVEDIAFTIAGEAHTAGLVRAALDLIVPPAHAHPGHFQGGEVTGELLGRFVVDFAASPGARLGRATLIAGRYESAEFTFGRAEALGGHTARLVGHAARGGAQVAFEVVVDAPTDRRLVGAPFAARVDAGPGPDLAFRLLLKDPFEADTLFDGVDFAALDADGDGAVALGPDARDPAHEAAYNQIRRTLLTHDHFEFSP